MIFPLKSEKVKQKLHTRYEAPGDLWVEQVENAVINIELARLSPREWPKVGRGTTKNSS